jgi:heme-degrading monooxygenase HmoA
MIARIWRTGVEPGREQEYETFAREISLPMFRAQQGYRGVLMGREGDRCIVVSLWGSMADVHALAKSEYYAKTVERIIGKGFLIGEQTTECFDAHLIDLAGADHIDY